jgi:hypothetical protein
LNKALLAFCATALLAAPAWGAPGSGRVTYKWVDGQGVVHYGDRVPPEYANQEQHIINAQGVEINHTDALKSAEQQAADEKKKQEVEDKLAHDRNLLTSYVSVQEIERQRDQSLGLISDKINVTTNVLEGLNGKMKRLTQASLKFRPYSSDPKAPPMNDQTAEDLVHLGNDIRTQQQNLQQFQSEENGMKKQFESDIARFKELKHIQ